MRAAPDATLASRLSQLGAISVFAFLVVLPLAIGLAAYSPVLVLQGDDIAFVDRLAQQLRWLPGADEFLRAAIRGGLPLADPFRRVLAATLPLAVASVAMLMAIREVQSDHPDSHLASADRVAWRVAVLLAVIAVFAFPTYTPDFWLSIAWGRMLAEGQNPYYAPFTPDVFQHLPGSGFEPQERFTYGPLWAFLIGGIGRLSGRRELLEFLLHKLVLTAAWLGTLATLRRVAGRRGAKSRLLVTCLVGWLPAGVYFAVAEGHNDVVMVFFLSLWLEAVDRRDHRYAPVWLACSGLMKFITLPLIGLELLAARRAGVLFTRRYLVTLAACGIGTFLSLLTFFDGPGFLGATRTMQEWIFWVPTTYVVNVAALAGLSLPREPVDRIITILGMALTALVLFKALRRPGWDTWVAGALAVTTCVLLTLVGHVWPWFTLWLIPFLAIMWPGRSAGVVLAFLLMVPLLDLAWILAPDWRFRPVVGMSVYTCVLVAMVYLLLGGRTATEPLGIGELP